MVVKDLAGYGLGAAIGDVVNVGWSIKDFADQKSQGANTATALTKSVGSFLSGEVYYSSVNKYIGAPIGKAITGGLKGLGVKQGVAGVIGGAASFAATIGFTLGQVGVSLEGAHMQNTTDIMSKAYGSRGKFGSGHFNMTDAGYTMRQRSLNAIRSNGLNTQSVLGNEARNYYRGAVQ